MTVYVPDEGWASLSDLQNYLIPKHYKGDLEKVLIPRGLEKDVVAKLASDIKSFYGDQTVHLLCVLKGARSFHSELIDGLEEIHLRGDFCHMPYVEHFIQLKSYVDSESVDEVVVDSRDIAQLAGKHVLIVEDILDTGKTLSKLVYELKAIGALSVKIAVLVDKRTTKRIGNFSADFIAFSIPDVFVVGRGFDYNQYFRDLPHCAVLSPDAIRKYSAAADRGV